MRKSEILLLWLFSMLVFSPVIFAATEEYARFDAKEVPSMLAAFVQDNSTTLAIIPPGGDSKWKIVYSGKSDLSIPLYIVDVTGAENCSLLYTASLGAQNLARQVYLEMNCVFQNGKRYFARGLDDVISSSKQRNVKAVFYLKKGARLQQVILGVRMEGPGELWISDLSLEKRTGIFSLPGSLDWIPGTLLGIMGGMYGFLLGIIPLHRQWIPVLRGYGFFCLFYSIVLLVIGFVMVNYTGDVWRWWSVWLLPGLVGVSIFTFIYRNWHRFSFNQETGQ